MASRNDLAIDADAVDAVDAVDADNAVESYAAVDACNAIDDNAVANGLIIPMANRLSLSRRSLQCGMPLSGSGIADENISASVDVIDVERMV